MTDPIKPDKIFTPEMLAELQRLEASNVPGVREAAYLRLSELANFYSSRVDEAIQAEEARRRYEIRFAKIALPAASAAMIGVLVDNEYLVAGGVGAIAVLALRNGGQILRDVVGIDPNPYRDAPDQLTYIQQIQANHAGRPVEGA